MSRVKSIFLESAEAEKSRYVLGLAKPESLQCCSCLAVSAQGRFTSRHKKPAEYCSAGLWIAEYFSSRLVSCIADICP